MAAPLPTVAQRVAHALAAVGKGTEYSGLCEAFTRSHYGFPRRYGSALDAYRASVKDGPVHFDTAPAGVPVFWDITSGKNAKFDHVAMSIGGGECVSTSAGPGGTVARVGIAALTVKWGMTYRGWAEYYHGTRVWTPKAPTNPDPDPEDEIMAMTPAQRKAFAEEVAREVWNYQNPNLEPDRDAYAIIRDTSTAVGAKNADPLLRAGEFKNEDTVLGRLDELQGR